ncbi:hypothetical protein C497_10588 [Halalkalicoccus jeotgali B3]|uniref:Uncharacterized protein n=1 Tax=Halalkalicoccus jeotgali (strain DSM 18796 / CECT 7217 / JCM 14584 / KCTC 4019 / B3) TaxID=795797 RepID=D8J673_HALJB|nr:hypothetical protein HacjB3_12040 [Halalkalicoccus jeotgali B3]ELY37185.1 hypothetical protein C497_10588 [Halalkalicoccus jeotgali B3]
MDKDERGKVVFALIAVLVVLVFGYVVLRAVMGA